MPEMKTSFALSSRASMMKNARRRKARGRDRKSTRLNSSHGYISYAVFCLKKKKKDRITTGRDKLLQAEQLHEPGLPAEIPRSHAPLVARASIDLITACSLQLLPHLAGVTR